MSEGKITILISALSLLVAIIIGGAQWLQNYRVNKQLEARRKEDIEIKVRQFIIKHGKDKRYIPLCFIAFKYDYKHTYKRDIYNDYNILTDEEQKELLKQLRYNFIDLDIDNWFDIGIDLIVKFIDENDLGNNLLNDDGKYLELSLLQYPDCEYDSTRELNEEFYPDIFSTHNIYFDNNIPKYRTINVRYYFFEYYRNVVINKDNIKLIKQLEKPMDLMIEKYQLRDCDDEELCFWMLNSTEYILRLMLGKLNYLDYDLQMQGDAIIETYEDKFLSVLMDMYNLILIKTKIEK